MRAQGKVEAAQRRAGEFWRPPKLNAYQREEALQRLAAGETQADIAQTFGVDPTTIGRLKPRPFADQTPRIDA